MRIRLDKVAKKSPRHRTPGTPGRVWLDRAWRSRTSFSRISFSRTSFSRISFSRALGTASVALSGLNLRRRSPCRAGRALGAAAVALAALFAVVYAAGASPARPDGPGASQARPDPPRTAHAVDHPSNGRPGDDPHGGFWRGTDSTYMAIGGDGHPYSEPAVGGTYGGYIGMAGNWATWQHCGGKVVWSSTDAADALTDLDTYHTGIGAGAFWFMAGPGVDPHYNRTYKEAFSWGEAQAAAALQAISALRPQISYQVFFMDIELPGYAPSFTPAPDNGWTSVYTAPCSGKVRVHSVPADVDRADFNGFADYLTAHSSYKVGVYSSPAIWTSIFGTGAEASVPGTYEWTYTGDTASLRHMPVGWCLPRTRTCARFFGGITSASKYALIWQWSGGGGTNNGYGDFDQIDGNRNP